MPGVGEAEQSGAYKCLAFVALVVSIISGIIAIVAYFTTTNNNNTTTPSASTSLPTAVPSFAPTALSLAPTASPTARFPTFAPTQQVSPTASPTASFPTFTPTQQVSPIMSFISTITLDQVTSSSLSDSDQQAIIAAAALSMQVADNQVVIIKIILSTSERLRDLEVEVAATNTFNVQTQTSVIVASSSQASSFYQIYSSRLIPTIFNTNLPSAAQTYNAKSLSSATAATITSKSYTYATPSSNDDNNLSGGAIAGIVIGVIIGVGLLNGIMWYFVVGSGEGGARYTRANKSTLDINVDF